ncbi:MAG: alpha/beta fold hydrolase [Leptolyngbyaceae cyanobacterium MO_188.B28]|nr:alpha/beta fold hydrolase [Leptolyngbyaceae cyanobacterium MO_188.B28]
MMKFKVDTELFPFESRFLETISGATVHYVDEGEGPTILMLHGNPTWSFLYRKMILKLRGRFRCIALDYPGFGLSTAPPDYDFYPDSHSQALREVIEKLGLTNFLLVMQDWCGPIGLAAAEQFPERVRGLILGNTWAWPLKGQAKFERFWRCIERRFRTLRIGSRRRFFRAS